VLKKSNKKTAKAQFFSPVFIYYYSHTKPQKKKGITGISKAFQHKKLQKVSSVTPANKGMIQMDEHLVQNDKCVLLQYIFFATETILK